MQTIHNFNIPINLKKHISSCTNDEPTISIEWMDQNLYNTMNFTFYANVEMKKFTLGAIAFQLAAEVFPNGAYDWLELFYFGKSLSAPFGNSYQCSRIKPLPLRLKNQNSTVGTVELSNLQFEAYRTGSDEEFSIPVNCRTDGKSNDEGWHKSEGSIETSTTSIKSTNDMKPNMEQTSNNSIRGSYSIFTNILTTTKLKKMIISISDILIITASVVLIILLLALAYFMYQHRCKSTRENFNTFFKVKFTESSEKIWS